MKSRIKKFFDGFYTPDGWEFTEEDMKPLEVPEVKLDYTPKEFDTSKFDKFLEEGEKDIHLPIAGAIPNPRTAIVLLSINIVFFGGLVLLLKLLTGL